MKLTKRQKEILEFITGFIEENGYSPSMEEIAGHFQFASLNAVFKHLEALESRGYLHRDSNRARSIQLATEEPVGLQILPLYGYVAAGQPIEAVSSPETLQVPDLLLPRRGNYFVLQVQGESMIEEQIRDGDFVVVESRQTANQGETVVALVDDENVTMKKFYKEGDTVRLQPANHTLEPIIVEASRVKVQGIVVSVMRKYQ
jgi:repressor LexA